MSGTSFVPHLCFLHFYDMFCVLQLFYWSLNGFVLKLTLILVMNNNIHGNGRGTKVGYLGIPQRVV